MDVDDPRDYLRRTTYVTGGGAYAENLTRGFVGVTILRTNGVGTYFLHPRYRLPHHSSVVRVPRFDCARLLPNDIRFLATGLGFFHHTKDWNSVGGLPQVGTRFLYRVNFGHQSLRPCQAFDYEGVQRRLEMVNFYGLRPHQATTYGLQRQLIDFAFGANGGLTYFLGGYWVDYGIHVRRVVGTRDARGHGRLPLRRHPLERTRFLTRDRTCEE